MLGLKSIGFLLQNILNRQPHKRTAPTYLVDGDQVNGVLNRIPLEVSSMDTGKSKILVI